MADLLESIEDGVAVLTLNRPEARNAMTWGMYDALAAAGDGFAVLGHGQVIFDSAGARLAPGSSDCGLTLRVYARLPVPRKLRVDRLP